MILHLYSPNRGGVGVSTLAAAFAIQAGPNTDLNDWSPAGDLAGTLGLPKVEPGEWVAVTPDVCLSRHGMSTFDREPDHKIFDWGSDPGVLEPDEFDTFPGHRIMVVRNDYTSLMRASACPVKPALVIAVTMPFGAIRGDDIEHALGAPCIESDFSPEVQRCTDAGLLVARTPGSLRVLWGAVRLALEEVLA